MADSLLLVSCFYPNFEPLMLPVKGYYYKVYPLMVREDASLSGDENSDRQI